MTQSISTIAILGGTGDLGTGLARRWAQAGYRVIIGSRTLDKARAAADALRAVMEQRGVDAVAVDAMENLDAVFALGQMENKIYVVGRSRVPEVDAGSIVTPLGGGGHPAAASATVRETTLTQAENHLLRLLYDNVKSRQRAEILMSSPPITIDAEASCAEASKRLNRYNVNALLVMVADQGV